MSLPKGNGQPKTPATVHVRGIRVCIIDDHSIVRAGVRMLLENHPGIEVVCEAATVSEALASAQNDPPDVVLLDLDLGAENGLDALPKLLSAFEPARFLVLTIMCSWGIGLGRDFGTLMLSSERSSTCSP